jgi:hypothetical protein
MQTSAAIIDSTERRPRAFEREYLAGGRIKGGILRAHVTWAREWASAEQLRALEAALPTDKGAALSSVLLATTWYPFSWLVELNRVIADTLGNGDRTILRQPGRYSANANLETVFRAFDRNDPHKFFRFSALLHTQFQDFGSATYEQVGPSHGRMHHRHSRCFSPYYCESAIGYYEQCARMHRLEDVVVEETICQCMDQSTCTFEIRWA